MRLHGSIALSLRRGGDELAQVQSELQAVKQALDEGTMYLGMKSETLQRFLLQLNEKEILLLSKQLRHVTRGAASEPLLPKLGASQNTPKEDVEKGYDITANP